MVKVAGNGIRYFENNNKCIYFDLEGKGVILKN